MVILVLGGRGFIGRHVAAAAIARGHECIVGSRNTVTGLTAVRQARFEQLTSPESWHSLLLGVDAVVNAVGILRQRSRETYDDVHHRAPAALAVACARLGLRLIHISALGLHDCARSRFILSKLSGERAIATSRSHYSIVRPSLVDGEGGFGARWIRWLARWPLHFTPANACGRIAALDVRDLGEAIATLCERPSAKELCEVELGGIASRTMAEYLKALRPESFPPAKVVPVPTWMARAVSHLCDLMHFSPFSFGHFELLQHDNVPRHNLLPMLLGHSPTPIGVLTPKAGSPRLDLYLQMRLDDEVKDGQAVIRSG